MMQLIVLAALLGGLGIVDSEVTNVTHLTHQQTNYAMRELAPVVARQYRRDPKGAQAQIGKLSFADKDWLRWYTSRNLGRSLFGSQSKNLLELIEKISTQMRGRVRMIGGGAIALSTVIAAGLAAGFLAAKILMHTALMAAYGVGAIIALCAAGFIVSFLIREEGVFASSLSSIKNLGVWDKVKLMRSLSSKLQGYLAQTMPGFNPNGAVIATTRDMHNMLSDMGPLQRLLGRLIS